MDTTSVFGQLRSLARRLDQGVVDVKDKISDPKQDPDSSTTNAYKHLQNMKKEVQALKEESRENLGTLQIANHRMQQLLRLLPQVIELHRQRLISTEDYLQQYGYVKQGENAYKSPKEDVYSIDLKPLQVCISYCLQQYGYVKQVKKVASDSTEKKLTGESKLVKDDVDATEDREDDDGTYTLKSDTVTQDVSSTPPTQLKPRECKTPCLEDFGISSLTLNMIKRGGAFTTTHQAVNSSVPKYDADMPEESHTPASLKHNGLLVTPSLMGGRSIMEETPDCTRTAFGIPFLQFNDSPASYQNQQSVQKNTSLYQHTLIPDNMGSPVPPVLYTPGAKQISKKLYQEEAVKKNTDNQDFDSPIPPLLMTPGAKQITKTICVPDNSATNKKPDNESPAVPVFMTPGAKQIQKTLTVPQAPEPLTTSDWDKEPEMPELTLSLQDITQLTQSFRLNQSSLQQPPQPPVSHSLRLKDRETPPLPELLSARLAQIGALPGTPSSNKASHNLNGNDTMSAMILGVTKDSTPPPPVLLGKYSFLSKNKGSQENIPPYGQ